MSQLGMKKPEEKVHQEPTTMISTDKNLMPSMVARQQRQQLQLGTIAAKNDNTAGAHWNRHDETNQVNQQNLFASSSIMAANELSSGIQKQMFDQNGLVLPRRLLHHSSCAPGQPPTTIRDLNRELKFNQVRGKNVLDQKSELKKALEKLEANKKRKEAEQERLNRRTSLELRLEERAERLAREGNKSSSETEVDDKTGNKGSQTARNALSNFNIKSSVR